MPWSVRLSRRIRDGLLAILGVAALSFAAFFALHEPLRRPVRLRMTAGQDGGTRHRIAQALRREAARVLSRSSCKRWPARRRPSKQWSQDWSMRLSSRVGST